MPPDELIKTIYLGDRGCKGISIDFWEKIIKLKIDCISRIRSSTGNWEYYNKECIDDGYIVFSDIENYKIDPIGVFACDFIFDFFIKNTEYESCGKKVYTFIFEVGYPAGDIVGCADTMTIEIKARELWLEDPQKPGVKIID